MVAFLFYLLLVFFPFLGLLFCTYHCMVLHKISEYSNSSHDTDADDDVEDDAKDAEDEDGDVDMLMKDICCSIYLEANSYLKKKYQYITGFSFFFAVLLFFLLNMSISLSFIWGCFTSIICGYVGMRVSFANNLKIVNITKNKTIEEGYRVALRVGTVIGFGLVSLSILFFTVLIFTYNLRGEYSAEHYSDTLMALTGFGFGTAVVTLFSRVAGNIYTQSTTSAAYLSGNQLFGVDENDIINPVCIANRVGDNIGHVAGTGTDFLGSLIESLCVSLVLGFMYINYYGWQEKDVLNYILFPLFLVGSSIPVNMFSYFIICLTSKIKNENDIVAALKRLLFIVTVLQTISISFCGYFIFPSTVCHISLEEISWWNIVITPLMGLWCGYFINLSTGLYTSSKFGFLETATNMSKLSAPTGIIFSLSLGLQSILIPTICLSATLGLCYYFCEFYGIALSAVGMLSTICTCLTLNVFAFLVDCACGISEMLKLSVTNLEKVQTLKATGSNMRSLEKIYSIGSSVLYDVALLAAVAYHLKTYVINLLEPYVIIGISTGAMLPYILASLVMTAVAFTAEKVIQECDSQIPSILDQKIRADYGKCVYISAGMSFKQCVLPGLVAIFTPLFVGILLGKKTTVGFMLGLIISGLPLSFSATNAVSTWDKTKKCVDSEESGYGDRNGHDVHENIMIGSIVGNVIKGTTGQALNSLIKLSAISSLVFANFMYNELSGYY